MNKENSVENMNTKGVTGYESISWAPHPPPPFPPPPPPKKKKKKKKNLWSPFSYKLPVISSPTRTLLRQRYIGFAVPSFFFCFATGIQNVRKRRRPYRKSEAFDSVVRRRRLWTVTVRYSYLPVVFQWCAFLKITLIFARCDVSEGKLLQEWFNWESVSGAADRTNFQNPKIAEDVMLPSN